MWRLFSGAVAAWEMEIAGSGKSGYRLILNQAAWLSDSDPGLIEHENHPRLRINFMGYQILEHSDAAFIPQIFQPEINNSPKRFALVNCQCSEIGIKGQDEAFIRMGTFEEKMIFRTMPVFLFYIQNINPALSQKRHNAGRYVLIREQP